MNTSSITSTVQSLAHLLMKHQLTLCTAESCTGGMVSAALTDLSGSSSWFERAYITYSNEAKNHDLHVPMDLIQTHGAVSVSVAKEMAIGALKVSGAKVSLAITGVAGPTGGSLEKPVGFVCFAWAWEKDGELHAESEGVALLDKKDMITDQTRLEVRTLARNYSLNQLLQKLEKAFG